MTGHIRTIDGRTYHWYYSGDRSIVERGRQQLLAMGKRVRVIREKDGRFGLYADGKVVMINLTGRRVPGVSYKEDIDDLVENFRAKQFTRFIGPGMF